MTFNVVSQFVWKRVTVIQTTGPATKKNARRPSIYRVDDVTRPAGDDVLSAVAGDQQCRRQRRSSPPDTSALCYVGYGVWLTRWRA